jgi:hypothetical protein
VSIELFLILVGFLIGYKSENMVEGFQVSTACVREFLLPRMYA